MGKELEIIKAALDKLRTYKVIVVHPDVLDIVKPLENEYPVLVYGNECVPVDEFLIWDRDI